MFVYVDNSRTYLHGEDAVRHATAPPAGLGEAQPQHGLPERIWIFHNSQTVEVRRQRKHAVHGAFVPCTNDVIMK